MLANNNQKNLMTLAIQMIRKNFRGFSSNSMRGRPLGAGGTMASLDLGISGNPISIGGRGGGGAELCQLHYYWHPRIFRSSYGPAMHGKIFSHYSM